MRDDRTVEGEVESRVGYQMKRAQHALRTEMDEALREMGLTAPQYAALSGLQAAPDLSGAELARRSFVTPQTMHQILTKLEKASLIVRRSHPEHGRVLQASLTEKGQRTVFKAHRVVESIEERMLARLDRDEIHRLAEALNRCAASLESGRKPNRQTGHELRSRRGY